MLPTNDTILLTTGIAGYVGGVGSYINSYGDGIINSTAASGGGTAEKKTAMKPTQAVNKTAGSATKGAASAARSLPASASSATKALPATSSPAQRTPPSKPPAKPAPAKAPPAKKPNTPSSTSSTTSKPVSSANNLPKISASAADKTSDGKVRISAASRPQKAGGGPHSTSSGVQKTAQNNSGPRPLPKISAGKEDRTPDGKIKISAASRPRPVKAA